MSCADCRIRTACDTILVQLVCIAGILTYETGVIHVSHFDQLAARAARQFQSVSAPVVRCNSISLNIPVCALQVWTALIGLIYSVFPIASGHPWQPCDVVLNDEQFQHTAYSDSLAQRGLSYTMIAVAATVTRFGFATISHWFCCILFSF